MIMLEDEKIPGKRKYSRRMEIYIWIGVILFAFFPVFYKIVVAHKSNFMEIYNSLIVIFLVIISPILFKLIYGKYPIEYLIYRHELKNKKEDGARLETVQVSHSPNTVINHYGPNNPSQESTATTAQANAMEAQSQDLYYLNQCVAESKNISERVFSRSGVYLLVGCLTAFIGVAIFYSPVFIVYSSNKDISHRLIDYLPRFGALFFIEFIAFFFLRQYRIMLEEYRYYEAIKRKRQDNLSMIEIVEKYQGNLELLKIVTENISQSAVTKLANGETTEILEAQKIVGQDPDIFTKFTELVKEIKVK